MAVRRGAGDPNRGKGIAASRPWRRHRYVAKALAAVHGAGKANAIVGEMRTSFHAQDGHTAPCEATPTDALGTSAGFAPPRPERIPVRGVYRSVLVGLTRPGGAKCRASDDWTTDSCSGLGGALAGLGMRASWPTVWGAGATVLTEECTPGWRAMATLGQGPSRWS